MKNYYIVLLVLLVLGATFYSFSIIQKADKTIDNELALVAVATTSKGPDVVLLIVEDKLVTSLSSELSTWSKDVFAEYGWIVRTLPTSASTSALSIKDTIK